MPNVKNIDIIMFSALLVSANKEETGGNFKKIK